MGRDFFDVVFLYGIGAKPNKELKEYLLAKTASFNFKALSKDVTPFLFNQKDRNKVELFPDFMKYSL